MSYRQVQVNDKYFSLHTFLFKLHLCEKVKKKLCLYTIWCTTNGIRIIFALKHYVNYSRTQIIALAFQKRLHNSYIYTHTNIFFIRFKMLFHVILWALLFDGQSWRHFSPCNMELILLCEIEFVLIMCLNTHSNGVRVCGRFFFSCIFNAHTHTHS